MAFVAFIFVILSYLLGSVVFGLVVAKLAGLGNLREQGSGNIGATNVLRVGGKKLGLITLALDTLKGLVPVLIARAWFSYDIALLCGFAVVLGHIFPIFAKFQGGKGVATGLAVIFALYWPAGLFAGAAWLAVFLQTRISSLSAMVSLLLTPFFSLVFSDSRKFILLCFVLSALIIWRHHANISRLLSGEEGKIVK